VIATYLLLLSLEFSAAFGGGGTVAIRMEFPTKELCTTMRRAIWSQLSEMKGDMGDCTPIPQVPTK